MIMLRRAAFCCLFAAAALAVVGCSPGLLPIPATPAPTAPGVQVVKIEVSPVSTAAAAVRFAVVGDPGLPEKRGVSQAVAEVCGFSAEPSCDFTLLLGDNLYPTGVRKRRQAEDRERLERIVAPLTARPVYLALGNHDWHPKRPRIARARRELEWIDDTAGVNGSAHFYSFTAGPVRLWALDTNYFVRRRQASTDPALRRWIDTIGAPEDGFAIAFGHHPYRSNGSHGNAGRFRDGGLRLWPGKRFADLMAKRVLPRVDLYLAGHEHNLQFFVEPIAGRQVATAVVGSAAKCSPRAKRPANPERSGVAAAFERYDHGFALVEATRERLTIVFYDGSGKAIWSAERRRGDAEWSYTPQEPSGDCR